jgi:transcriptional regulator with XRE-family HTH domain
LKIAQGLLKYMFSDGELLAFFREKSVLLEIFVYMTISSFWTRVKQLMDAHKIDQEKFAGYIGVNFGTFKNWMHYGRFPDVLTVCCIAEALGVSVEYLVRGDGGKDAEARMRRTEERKNAASQILKLAGYGNGRSFRLTSPSRQAG